MHKAILIQDIQEYLLIVKEQLNKFLEQYASYGISEESVLQWIIDEELELIYGLSVNWHDSKLYPQQKIHNQLSSQFCLSVFTKHYIKMPNLYGDDCLGIEVTISGHDLHIAYYHFLIKFSF